MPVLSAEVTVRRNARALISILLLVVGAGLLLGFQTINLGGIQRGGDTFLGLSLGLDLQGGSHLVYRAEPIAEEGGEPQPPNADDMESLQRIIERRVNSSGLGEPIIQILGEDRLLIQLPGVGDPERAEAIIGETAQLEFKHRRISPPRNLATEGTITDEDVISVSAQQLPEELLPESDTESSEAPESTEDTNSEIPVIIVEFTEVGASKFDQVHANLLQEFATAAATLNVFTYQNQLQAGFLPSFTVSIAGNEFLDYVVAPPGISKLEGTNQYVFPYPQPSPDLPADPDETPEPVEPDDLVTAQAKIGDAATVTFIEQPGRVDEDFGLGGDNLSRAYASLHAQSDQPIINLEFDSLGTRLFGEKTSEIAGSPTDSIAIFLDGEELIAPVVRQPITTGTAIIEGGFTLERAQDISLLLEGGRLPFPITLLQRRSVDAILGADSLAKSVVAGAVGLALVFLFMTLYYRVPGLVASVALLIYTALVLAIFKLMPVTLTLSGVAATILSVGMAVDANVLIFERMKDELRNGRTLISAINIGFNRAWPAIRDSNVSTLITCAILYYFSNQLGTTIVQGFAATLAIGVMVSMFSAIVVSRTILRVIATTRLSRLLGAFVPTGASELPQQPAAAAAQRG
ncbi:MAG: protein translocase subunit SecD [Chloroflexi bacterium]|nr:protein translocase subunit SecD [Chloroflexota bacterium]